MNEMIDFEISRFTLLEILFVGVLLFIGLRLVRAVLDRLAHSGGPAFFPRSLRHYTGRFWPLIETIIWTLFALNALSAIFQDRLYYTGALMIVLLVATAWFSWYVLKDWFAGVVIKIRDVYQVNQMIQIGDIRGTVRRLGDLTLEIEQDDGEIAEIPYSRASSQILHKGTAERSAVTTYRFEVKIAKDGSSIAAAGEMLRNAILHSPWFSSRQNPQVHLLEETETEYRMEAKIAAPDRQIARAVEADVQEFVKSL